MKAQEAHELAATLPGRRRGDGRGVGPGLRHCEREFLRLLLRLTRDDTGMVPWPRATKWLAGQTGYSPSSIERARRRLVQLELVEVLHRGSGEDPGSLYRVAIELIRPSSIEDEEASPEPDQDHLLPGVAPVHPPENPVPVDVSGSARCVPPVGTVPTPDRNGADPYTRARRSTGFSGSTKPPNPPPASPAGGTASTTPTSPNCPAARRRGGTACENCRQCGTTRRQLDQAARAAAKTAGVVPPCGVCDPVTRLEELDDGTMRRCPVCHPKRDELAAVAGDDLVHRWAGEHLAELESSGVSKTQTRREEAG